jgi:hypothetical protein
MKVNNLWRYPTYLNTIQEVIVNKVAWPASSLPAGTRCYILRTICTLENRRTVRLRGKVGFDKKMRMVYLVALEPSFNCARAAGVQQLLSDPHCSPHSSKQVSGSQTLPALLATRLARSEWHAIDEL